MAANGSLRPDDWLHTSTLYQQLAIILPQDTNFRIYHLSTPPTPVSSLYSALPGARPDRTYCESHFLTASILPPPQGTSSETVEVLVFAIEVLIYSTVYDTTFFVSKADSTGFLHLLNLPKGASSPLKVISGTFLKHLVEQRQRPNLRSIVSLFARAQDQYLFPGSVEYNGKHVLDDRGLVRWWCRVLSPLIEEESKNTEEKSRSLWESTEGYLIVPGLDTHETLSYIPKTTKDSWTIGHPLQKISRHSVDAPPRCLIPHYPDDPKARYLDELDDEITKGKDTSSGRWKSIKSLDQFWEMMAFRQECSAGRLVGFIWVVFTPTPSKVQPESAPTDSQSTTGTDLWDHETPPSSSLPTLAQSTSTSSAVSSQPERGGSPLKQKAKITTSSVQPLGTSRAPLKTQKKKLTGRISPRQPRIKTHNKNRILEKPENTAYYTWPELGRGQVVTDESDYKRITELLLRLDFANLELASSSSRRWISEVRSGAWVGMDKAWGQEVIGTKAPEVHSAGGASGVNTLSVGLVRKKRKVGEDEPRSLPPDVTVNVLGAGMIRKKPKS